MDHRNSLTSSELIDSVDTVSLLDITAEFPESPPSPALLTTWESLALLGRLCAGESLSGQDTLI